MLRWFRKALAGRSARTGAVLYVAMRWFDRLLGLISTIILARLLSPDDFGVIALAGTAIGLASVLLDMGISIALIQKKHLDKADIDTAWTLRLIQDGTLALGIGIASPFVASYFGDARLGAVLVVLAIAQGVQALQGMGPVLLQKEMRFGREVAFLMSRRLIAFVVTVVLAFLLKTYWALVLGTLVGSIAGVALSYLVYPLMPSFTLRSWRMFIGSSLWLTLRSFCSYSNEQIDKLIVGKREGASVLGAYSIADQMAQMPSSELIGPMARALFPAYASIKDDTDRLKRAFLLALGVQATIGLPAGIGLALVSSEATSLILSEKWRFAAPFMAVLACTYSLHAIVNSSGYLLLATGRFRENSLIHATVLVSFLVIVIFLAPEMHAFDIALTRLASGFFSLSLFVGFAVRQLGQGTVRAIASVLFRPIIATSIMALSIFGFADELNALENLPRFIAKVTIGVFGYLTSLLGLWVLQRRPFGAERWILTLVFSRWKST